MTYHMVRGLHVSDFHRSHLGFLSSPLFGFVGGYPEASFNVYDAALTTTDEIVRIDPRRIGNDYNPRRGWGFGKLTKKIGNVLCGVSFFFRGGLREDGGDQDDLIGRCVWLKLDDGLR